MRTQIPNKEEWALRLFRMQASLRIRNKEIYDAIGISRYKFDKIKTGEAPYEHFLLVEDYLIKKFEGEI
jgi:hypothetical protein